MINSLNGINLNNIYGARVVEKTQKAAAPSFSAQLPIQNSTQVSFSSCRIVRTKLNKNEQKLYSKVISNLPQEQRPQLENLLKKGILLDSRSNDNSTVLDNLYRIINEKSVVQKVFDCILDGLCKMFGKERFSGFDKKIVLSELVNTLNNPFVITQKFGDIPDKELEDIVNNPKDYAAQDDSPAENYTPDIKNVRSSSCVAASIEFDLASKQPAEFARIACGLTSKDVSVDKKLKMSDIGQNWVEADNFLKEFKSEYKRDGWDNIVVTMRPDRNAVVRARIQSTHKDPNERSLIDVLMQSTFMNIGSQRTYNSLTDIRTGKYNPDNTGLTDIEKSFAEAITTGKSKCSVTYQKLDDNGFITGYECDFPTMKKHIKKALDMGENVIVGYTQKDETGKVINGHEITIVKIEKDASGKEIFVCNDTDDESDLPVKYYVDDFIPTIHHAGLPKAAIQEDLDNIPQWHEAINYYKELKNKEYKTAA